MKIFLIGILALSLSISYGYESPQKNKNKLTHIQKLAKIEAEYLRLDSIVSSLNKSHQSHQTNQAKDLKLALNLLQEKIVILKQIVKTKTSNK